MFQLKGGSVVSTYSYSESFERRLGFSFRVGVSDIWCIGLPDSCSRPGMQCGRVIMITHRVVVHLIVANNIQKSFKSYIYSDINNG